MVVGLVLVPSGLVMTAMAPVSARISREGCPKVTLIVGALVAASGYGLNLLLMTELWQLVLVSSIIGAGIGLAYGAMPALITSAVPVTEIAAAANSFNTAPKRSYRHPTRTPRRQPQARTTPAPTPRDPPNRTVPLCTCPAQGSQNRYPGASLRCVALRARASFKSCARRSGLDSLRCAGSADELAISWPSGSMANRLLIAGNWSTDGHSCLSRWSPRRQRRRGGVLRE